MEYTKGAEMSEEEAEMDDCSTTARLSVMEDDGIGSSSGRDHQSPAFDIVLSMIRNLLIDDDEQSDSNRAPIQKSPVLGESDSNRAPIFLGELWSHKIGEVYRVEGVLQSDVVRGWTTIIDRPDCIPGYCDETTVKICGVNKHLKAFTGVSLSAGLLLMDGAEYVLDCKEIQVDHRSGDSNVKKASSQTYYPLFDPFTVEENTNVLPFYQTGITLTVVGILVSDVKDGEAFLISRPFITACNRRVLLTGIPPEVNWPKGTGVKAFCGLRLTAECSIRCISIVKDEVQLEIYTHCGTVDDYPPVISLYHLWFVRTYGSSEDKLFYRTDLM